MTKDRDELVEKTKEASMRFGTFATTMMGFVAERMSSRSYDPDSEPAICEFLKHSPWEDPAIACLAILTAMVSTKSAEEWAQFTGIPIEEVRLAVASCQAVAGFKLIKVDEAAEKLERHMPKEVDKVGGVVH